MSIKLQMIMQRRKYNYKRKLHDGLDQGRAHFLAESVTYIGSPLHKRVPGDFGLTPPPSPRPGKTLCDGVGIFQKDVARKLLKMGAAKGLVSRDADHSFPRYIWIVTDAGDVLEARCDDTVRGTYHGYPLASHDPMVELVMK